MTNPATLRRIRWAVRATLTFGVAASVAANVLHANPNVISQTIAAWPPMALLLTVELVSRVPVHRPMLAVLRVLATVVISGIAAWVSYWHMAGVAARYGETDASPYLLPISVDGLIVVASISLVELAGRIRASEKTSPVVPMPAPTIAAPTANPAITSAPSRPTPGPPTGPPTPQPIQLGPDLIAAARTAAADHRRITGQAISRDALRDRLRISTAVAGELHRTLRRTHAPA
jgi:hypothetical protein